MQLAEKLDTRNQQINHLKDTNAKLKQTIKTLSTASKEQMEIIRKLQKQVDRAEELENYQRDMILKLEQELENAKATTEDDLDDPKVEAIEQELEELRDKLKRTLIEKDFIESHLLELDDSLEKAKETEKALQRAQEEIAALEKQHPEFTPQIEDQAEPEATASVTNMAMHEMEEIDVENMLFDPLSSFWNTLDNVYELTLQEASDTQVPNEGMWASLTIGDNEYALLLNIDQALAEKISSSIVKEDTENPQLDCLEQLGRVMAQPLADDMVNNQVQAAEDMEPAAAIAHIKTHEAITECLAVTEDKYIYAVLTSLRQEKPATQPE